MRSALLRAVVALAAGGLVLAGCATPVTGSASPGAGEPADVPADQLTIVGATDNPIDRQVRNALTDIDVFWQSAYPRYFGHPFQPLSGGFFSVDSDHVDHSAYPPTGIGCAAEPVEPELTKDNAFYNPHCDAIAYDRTLLSGLEAHAGRALPPIVLAHEFGHAMQGRFGFAADGRSIQDETQADCFAGAWTAWVVAGHAKHVAIRTPELDQVLSGYLTLSDPVGSDPGDTQAHGSYFDRLAAFSDGYDKGVASCRDDFGPQRVYTDQAFTNAQDAEQNGNAPYSEVIDIADTTLPQFWTSVFRDLLSKTFRAPRVTGFSGSAPSCADSRSMELVYCRSGATVYFDERELTRPAYKKIGDWAVATAISLPYALAARSELGRSTGDAAAMSSAVCLTGWYTARVFDGDFSQGTLSPGDVDEAVRFLLTYGVSDQVFPNTRETGFDLLRSFKDGFLHGGKPCGIGL